MKNTAAVIITFLLGGTVNVYAQSVGPATINAAGNTVTIAGNQFDWSVGEMTMVSTFTTPDIVITQGVLQPSEPDHTGVTDHSLLPTHLQVFPNPASSIVNLQYAAAARGTLTYRLLAMDGKVILQKTINVMPGTVSDQVNISELACATYMLQIAVRADNATEESISYKIEKLK